MLQVEDLLMTIGILNRECDILPPGSNRAAFPEEAIQSTIFPFDQN